MPEQNRPTPEGAEKWGAMKSHYKPKEPGEDYVTDPEKARAMADAEKPFRNEKADLKNKIPSAPKKPKEPSVFSRFTGIGMAKHEQAVADRKQAIEQQGKAIIEVVEKGRELDEKAKVAAEKAEKDYVPESEKGYATVAPKRETHSVRIADMPEGGSVRAHRADEQE